MAQEKTDDKKSQENKGDQTAPTQFTITITGTGVNPDAEKAREFVQGLADNDMKVSSATFSAGPAKESIMPKSEAQKENERKTQEASQRQGGAAASKK